jgi:hypothetical protein
MCACSEEDAPPAAIPDETKPTITIVEPTDLTNPLRARVTIKAEATDDTGITKVEVFVNGKSIASATSSPVEASWDTKTVFDGSHVIKVVAEDAEGNKEEKVLSVEVKNVLFTFPIDATFLSEFGDGWIYVSDENNSVIEVKQMKNDESLIFNTPVGYSNGKRYSFHIVDYFFYDYGLGTTASTSYGSYVDVLPGTFIINREKRTAIPSVGKHTLFIGGCPSFSSLFGYTISKDANLASYSGTPPALPDYVIPVASTLAKSPADIIYFLFDNEAEMNGLNNPFLFHRVENAIDNTDSVVDYSSLLPMDYLATNFTDAISSEYSLSYLRNAGDYNSTVFLYRQSNSVMPNELHIHYPDITFPEYVTSITYENNDARYTYIKASSQVNNEFKKISANINSFSSEGDKISYSATGTFTHVAASSVVYFSDGFNSGSYDRFVFGANNSKGEMVFPELPQEIADKYPELGTQEFVFETFILYNNTGIPSFDKFMEVRFSGKSIFTETKERFLLIKGIPSFGGRRERQNTARRTEEFLYQ